jgi:hypothetical protein
MRTQSIYKSRMKLFYDDDDDNLNANKRETDAKTQILVFDNEARILKDLLPPSMYGVF